MTTYVCIRFTFSMDVRFFTPHTSHLPSHLTPHTSHLTPHTSHLTPHTSHLTSCTSHITHHTSHLTPHTSHITPHTSHLTPHTSLLILTRPIIPPQVLPPPTSSSGITLPIASCSAWTPSTRIRKEVGELNRPINATLRSFNYSILFNSVHKWFFFRFMMLHIYFVFRQMNRAQESLTSKAMDLSFAISTSILRLTLQLLLFGQEC